MWKQRSNDVVIPDIANNDKNIHLIVYSSIGLPKARLAPNEVSIQKTTVSFGDEVAKWLGTDYLQVGIDPVTKTFSLIPSAFGRPNTQHIYHSQHDKGYRMNFNAIRKWVEISFKQKILSDHYKAVWSQQLQSVKVTYKTEST